MKIGLLVDDTLDKPDGVQQYVVGLGRWLTAQGHEVHYLAGESHRTDLPNLHSLSRTVNVKFNGNSLGTPLPASRRHIHQLVRELQLDVIHVQSPHSPFLAQHVISAAAATTAIISTFHILPDNQLATIGVRLLRPLLRPSLRRIDTMFAVSDEAQRYVRAMWHVEVSTLPNHIKLGQFEGAQPFERYAGKLTMVFLSRLVPRKGAMHLVRAIAYMRDNRLFEEPYQLILCGKGEQKPQLEDYIRQHHLENIVTLEGFVSEEDKSRYMASADIAVYPSTGGESFGIVLLEGMAAAKGVVLAGNNPGYACVMRPHPGQLVEPADTKAFAEKLAYYLSDESARLAARDRQRADVKQYDINVVGAKLLTAYEQALTHRRR